MIVLNSLYWSKDVTDTNEQADKQMTWLKETLANAPSDRKFILNFHIYNGARWSKSGKDMWLDDYNTQFWQIVQDHSEKIVITAAAHDHYADVRYHSSSLPIVADEVEQPTLFARVKHALGLAKKSRPAKASNKDFFYNLILAPSFTPNKQSMPGYSTFDIDSDTLIPSNY